MLKEEPRRSVCELASYSCQNRSLGLQPWQPPPCHIDLASALRAPFGDQRALREAGEILKRLLELNLSRFEPDPWPAIEQAKAKLSNPPK